jgi:hypothetical protein
MMLQARGPIKGTKRKGDEDIRSCVAEHGGRGDDGFVDIPLGWQPANPEFQSTTSTTSLQEPRK